MGKALSAVFVKRVTEPGKYYDLHGLILIVRAGGTKYWAWRGTVRGKRKDLGIGTYPYISLREARDMAFQYRRASKLRQDPRAVRACPKFAQAVESVIALNRPAWKQGGGTEQQWRTELAKYAIPRLGTKPVDQITTADVMATLVAGDLWTTRPSLAGRLRQRIGAVMKWSVAQGHRDDNPAGDAIAAALPKHNGRVKHHRALPHVEVAAAVARVRESGAWAGVKLAFEFMVVTATRTGEVRLARWNEIDLEARTWTIPANRMKAGRPHRVPLSERALEILRDAANRLGGQEGLVFPSRRGKVLNQTTIYTMLRRLEIPSTAHGFRASFRTWCGDSAQPRELAEAALAHVVPNATEAAYTRGTIRSSAAGGSCRSGRTTSRPEPVTGHRWLWRP